jgi:hypothetical protein
MFPMTCRTLLLIAVSASALAAADAPYIGTWKANMAKSDFAGTTLTFEKLSTGEWHATADGISYKFRMDGKDYSDNLGDTAAWKAIDSYTWQTAWKVNGRFAYTDTLRIGAGGVLTISSKGTKPNGEPIDQTLTSQRVSGGPGLAGTWKSKAIQDNAPQVIQFIATAGHGLVFKNNYGVECAGKTDGTDQTCKGPLTPAGWTSVVTIAGGHLTSTLKKDGKPLYRYEYTVSADGKTLTQVGASLATNEKIKVVFDRQ